MRRGGIALVALVSALAACVQESDNRSSSVNGAPPVLTAADLGDQVALTAADYFATEPYASADRRDGLHQVQLGRHSHSLDKNAPRLIGPNLYGFFGRKGERWL